MNACLTAVFLGGRYVNQNGKTIYYSKNVRVFKQTYLKWSFFFFLLFSFLGVSCVEVEVSIVCDITNTNTVVLIFIRPWPSYTCNQLCGQQGGMTQNLGVQILESGFWTLNSGFPSYQLVNCEKLLNLCVLIPFFVKWE